MGPASAGAQDAQKAQITRKDAAERGEVIGFISSPSDE
jgi:hypothetical protein